MTTINLATPDETYNAPLGELTVNGQGNNRLVVDYSSLTEGINSGINYPSNYFSDEFFNTISFSGFSSYDITGGSGDDNLYVYGKGADRLSGGGVMTPCLPTMARTLSTAARGLPIYG